MKITEFIKTNTLYLDGGMGTLLQAAGLAAGELPERQNLSHPALIRSIHQAYYDAGSHVVATNTFGANTLKLSAEELEAIIAAAVENARAAAAQSSGTQPKWVALDVGPTGRMLRPYGDLDFEDAVVGALAPKTVVVLTDTWCRDAGEVFVQAAKRAGARLIGRPTLGTLDYCGDHALQLNDRFIFHYPSAVSAQAMEGRGIQDTGILPDEYIPFTPEECREDILLDIALS